MNGEPIILVGYLVSEGGQLFDVLEDRGPVPGMATHKNLVVAADHGKRVGVFSPVGTPVHARRVEALEVAIARTEATLALADAKAANGTLTPGDGTYRDELQERLARYRAELAAWKGEAS